MNLLWKKYHSVISNSDQCINQIQNIKKRLKHFYIKTNTKASQVITSDYHNSFKDFFTPKPHPITESPAGAGGSGQWTEWSVDTPLSSTVHVLTIITQYRQ